MVVQREPALSGDTKRCRRCGRDRPVEFFNRHPKTADGLSHMCSECWSEVVQEGKKRAMDKAAGRKIKERDQVANGKGPISEKKEMNYIKHYSNEK